MNNVIKRFVDACDRVVEFGSNNPLNPAIAVVTALYTQAGNVATAIRGHKGDQESGRGEFLGGCSCRALKAAIVLEHMRPINKIVRSLKRDEYPGLREKFYMPRNRSYENILGRAQAFLDAIGPIKPVLVARGLPADFDELLQGAQVELLAAKDDKHSGLATQVGGTAGLFAKSLEGLQCLRELDAILSYHYRNNPAVLAAWKSACHVERDPQYSAGAPEAPAPAPAPVPTA